MLLSSIYIKDQLYLDYKIQPNSKFLSNLSQINLFVGSNNSGKSRLLRRLFSDEELKFNASDLSLDDFNKLFWGAVIEFNKKRKTRYGEFFGDMEKTFSRLERLEYLREINDFTPYVKILDDFEKTYGHIRDGAPEHEAYSVLVRAKLLITDLLQKAAVEQKKYNFKRIYIPTLRGLRPIQAVGVHKNSFEPSEDNYLHRTIYDYFKPDSKLNENIYTGLSLYEDLKRYSHGTLTQREQLDNFEKFLSETFFQSQDVELIPSYGKDVINVRIGNHEADIFNLGDGIQSIIILTYPLFFNQGKYLKVFIEEPESHLHPGFQRVFMETLSKPEFNTFQYFISTHSNHFLDLTLDKENISIYTLEKENSNSNSPSFIIQNVENSSTHVLTLLGVRNSSVFLTNCTIWVEGISDRIYFRKYLELIQEKKENKFLEDIHFSFVEYAGNNITHWSFLEPDDSDYPNILVDRLCSKLFLITDSDNSDFNRDGTIPRKPSKKAERHIKLLEKLDERYYCLKVREVENLLSPSILKRTVIALNQRSRNIEFREFKQRDYQREPIGSFIESNTIGLTKKLASETGTLINKIEFSKTAVSLIKTVDELSSEATEIADKLYNFIAAHNH